MKTMPPLRTPETARKQRTQTTGLGIAAVLLGWVLLASSAGLAEPPASSAPPASAPSASPPATAAPATATPSSATAPPAGEAPATQATPTAPAAAAAKGASKPTGTKKGKPPKGGAAAKPAAPPPKPPVPNQALAQLKPLEGSWACAGRTFGPGPEHATSGAMTFSWRLDGFWLEVRYEEPKGDAANPVPVSSIALWGFDDLQHGLAASAADNIGGSATQSASGWQGDKLVFEGPAHRFAVQFQVRDSFVRHGDVQFAHTQEANVNDNWIKLHEDTCSRLPTR